MLSIILPPLIFCGIAVVAAVLLTLLYPDDYQGEQPNYWKSVCWYFVSSKGRVRTKRKMLKYMKRVLNTRTKGMPSTQTLDYYLRILTKADYIKVVGPEKYRMIVDIPEGTTTKDVRFIAYELDKLFEPIPENYPGWSSATK